MLELTNACPQLTIVAGTVATHRHFKNFEYEEQSPDANQSK